MKTKWCGAGQHEASVESFWKRQGRLQPNCKVCQSDINKRRYRLNKKQHIRNVIKNTQNRMQLFQKWKQTLCCVVCGEKHTPCLDFHHIDPNVKDFTVGEAFGKYGSKRVVEEARKCAVVCKNCHTKIHSGVTTISAKQHCNTSLLEDMLGV